MAQSRRRPYPDDLDLDLPIQVVIPYKRCAKEYNLETRKITISRPEEADIAAKLSVPLHPDLYGVFPRILILWICKQITHRQYLPVAIAREIPLISFDLYVASLELMNGVTAEARQTGLGEVFNGVQHVRLHLNDLKPPGGGIRGRNFDFISRLVVSRKILSWEDDLLESSEQALTSLDFTSRDSVFNEPSILEVTDHLHSYAMSLKEAPDMGIVSQIAHSPLALDIYADMLHRGIKFDEWDKSDIGLENLWLDWPGKEAVSEADMERAQILVRNAVGNQ